MCSINMFLFLIGAFGCFSVSAGIPVVQEGDECSPAGGGQGIYRLHSKCDIAGNYSINNERKVPEPFICCPFGQKVEKYCRDVELLFTRKYGQGCQAVSSKKHRHLALIGYQTSGSKMQWTCMGSLINRRYLLSSAVCGIFLGKNYADSKWARMGAFDMKSSKENSNVFDWSIVEVFVYPEFNQQRIYHNIGLFKLSSDVNFNEFVMPVCLQTERSITQKTAKIFSNRPVNNFADTNTQFYEEEIDIYNHTECRRLMFECDQCRSRKTPLGYLPDLTFCAGDHNARNATSCFGDAEPLVIKKSGKCIYTGIGILSYGFHCGMADRPDVYTRVSKYIPWIEEIAFKDVLVS